MMNENLFLVSMGLLFLLLPRQTTGIFFGNDNNNEDSTQNQPICYITYTQHYQTKYITVQRPVCSTVYKRVCQRDYKTIESTEYDRNCKQEYETKCDTIYRTKYEQECKTVNECGPSSAYDSYGAAIDNCHDKVKCSQVSKQVPEQSCRQTPKEVCETVPRKNFQQIPFQNCENRPEKQCHPVPQRIPRQFPYSIPHKRCYQNQNTSTTTESGGILGIFG